MNYCTECGAEVEGDETWCHECGVRLDQSEDTGGGDGNTLLQGVIGGVTLGIAILIILMAVVGTFALGLGENVESDTPSPDTVTEPDTDSASGDTEPDRTLPSEDEDSTQGEPTSEQSREDEYDYPDSLNEDMIKDVIEKDGMVVENISSPGNRVLLTYRTSSLEYIPPLSGLSPQSDMNAVVGVYWGLIEGEDGWDKDVMEVTVLNMSGSEIASYRVRSEWIGEYNRDEITWDTLEMKILETLEATGRWGSE
jgi:hypothetical protein